MMKYVLIHSQQSLGMFVKQIISKINSDINIEVYKTLSNIDESTLKRDDIIFLLQNVEKDDEQTIAHLKMRCIVVGCGESDGFSKFSHTLDSSLINISKVNELTLAIEKIFFNIENKIIEHNAPSKNDYLLETYVPKKVDAILIGVSTGGPEVLQQFLKEVSPLCVPILIAQHLPKGFSSQLSEYLQNESKNQVTEVLSKTLLKQGQIAIAQSGFDVELINQNDQLFAVRKELNNDPFHPSIDRLFVSASTLSARIVAIVLTGMGKDGTIGCTALKQSNKYIIAQEPSTCIVDGMPRSIIEAGLNNATLTPAQIIKQINTWSKFHD